MTSLVYLHLLLLIDLISTTLRFLLLLWLFFISPFQIPDWIDLFFFVPFLFLYLLIFKQNLKLITKCPAPKEWKEFRNPQH